MALAKDSHLAGIAARHAVFLRRLRRVTPVASTLAAIIGAVGLLGWAFHSERLVRIASDSGAMVPMSALGILACAVSLLLLYPEPALTRRRRRAGLLFALCALLTGAIVAFDYVTPARVNLDLLLFPRALREFSHGEAPRPSPLTALNLLATGFALLMLNVETRRGFRPAQILAVLVGLIAAQTLVSYIYDKRPLLAPEGTIFHITPFNTMAVQTALAFGLLCVGVMYARPERGLTSPFNGDNPGSYLARRLFPAVILAPFLVGWLGALGQRYELYDAEYGLSFVVMMTILLMMILVAWLARALRRIDLERRQALQISRENEALFRAIFENAGLGIAVVSPDGRPVRTNRALQEMLRYSAEELAQMPFRQFTHPDDVDADVSLYNELMAGKIDSYRIEKRYIRKDGQVVWGLLTTSVARDEAHRPSVYIGTVTDITEAKKTAEAQRRLTAILQTTPDFVGISDAQGRALYLNRAGRKLVGLGDEDLNGLTIPDFHPKAAAEFLLNVAIPNAIRDGVWSGDTVMLRNDGKLIPVSQVIMSHRGRSGEVEYLSTVIRDISEQRRMENTQRFLLEASRTLSASLELEAVLQNVLDMSVPSQGDYCVIDLVAEGGSIARAAMKHRDPAQQQQLEAVRQFSPEPGPQPGLPRVLQTGESFMTNDVDAQLLRQITQNEQHYQVAKRIHPTSLMIVPMIARGRVIGALTLARVSKERVFDESDLNCAEELAGRAALALENARLFRSSTDATHLRDEVLRVVAHDLRNPLNGILLSAQVLREEGSLDPDQSRNLLDVIVRSTERANRLIQDLLDVARMEEGRLSLNKGPVDPAELLHEAVALQAAMAQKKTIELDEQVPGEMPAIDADHDRILQVLTNLLDNAIKFTEPGGRIAVRAQSEDGLAQFAVSDSGPGIEEKDMPHLFDRFWQAQKGEGAGLGLGIARGIVEAHGGRIWAETALGQGSTFYFTVPLHRPEQQRHDAAAD